MAMAPGARLGPYKVIGPLGVGGMGEVYRARDTKLEREVAIKVLPELFAGDPERLNRFEREARTLAAFNHQNIAQVHGVLEQPPALVMELVEGETIFRPLWFQGNRLSGHAWPGTSHDDDRIAPSSSQSIPGL